MKLLKAFTLVVLIAGVLLCVAGLYWENKLTNLGIPIALLGIALSVAIPVKKRSEGENTLSTGSEMKNAKFTCFIHQ